MRTPRSRSSRARASAARAFRSRPRRCAGQGRRRSRRDLDAKFGNGPSAPGTKDFSSTSIGPTFGKTIANSAVIAIIASLLVISAYIALRFEWKYAIPVLIALMHDLLITAGVYSLTGPGSDDGDGRGAADDPGVFAVRHDHRVRSRARERAAHAARRVLADRQPLDVGGADADRWRRASARCCR